MVSPCGNEQYKKCWDSVLFAAIRAYKDLRDISFTLYWIVSTVSYLTTLWLLIPDGGEMQDFCNGYHVIIISISDIFLYFTVN